MVHNTKKKALYEVIGRAGAKPGYEQLHPNGTAGQTPSAGSTLTTGKLRAGAGCGTVGDKAECCAV